MIAKYYPSTGWYVSSKNLTERLNAMFHADDFGDITYEYADSEGIKAKGGMYDGSSHELEYEVP